MQTVIGINALKDKYREAKIRVGDMRGMSVRSRFAIAERIGVSDLQVVFDSIGPRQGKVEIEIEMERDGQSYGSVYNMADLIEDVKSYPEMIIQFVKVKWNKQGTDADRSNIGEQFLYRSI